MARTLAQWPIADPLVAGDPALMAVTIDTDADIADWEWVAHIRARPRSAIITSFTIDVDPDDDHRLLLRLTGDQTALLSEGYGFDLRQTAPIEFTWLRVESLNVEPSYSAEDT